MSGRDAGQKGKRSGRTSGNYFDAASHAIITMPSCAFRTYVRVHSLYTIYFVHLRTRSHPKDLFDVIIWVDASKRLGNSEITNKISIEDAHFVVHNNGTFEEFQEKAKVIGKL